LPRELDRIARRLQRLAIRLDELAAYRDRARAPLGAARFWARDADEPSELALGGPWPTREFPVRIAFDARVPEAWAGSPVHARLAIGGEGLLIRDGVPIGGLNPYHTEHPLLGSAAGGESLLLEIEAVPRGLFGRPNEHPRLEQALLALPDLEFRSLHDDLAAALAAATYLEGQGRETIAVLLAEALDDALLRLDVDRADSEAYLARLVQSPAANEVLRSIWEEWSFDRAAAALPDELRAGIPALRARFATSLERIRQRYPAEGSLWLTGHAHIDLAWLWPLAETRRKARRTFATVLGLMDRFPGFHFNQSSSQLYAYVEQDDPALFDRVRERVREGRWDVVGGMWVEPDGNLLSGESWARQLLHGQRYLQERFGLRARVCWLPDTFGYAGNLPQLLAQAGIPYFFTTKLTWNEQDVFPHDLYRWEGIDGTTVLAHSFFNPHGGYNGHVEPRDLGETWRSFAGKHHHPQSLLSYGHGDGGGGPTAEMIEWFERLQDFPGLPRLETGRVEAFYDRIDPDRLPVWVGEKYLQFHRGTYTSQARTKALHRRLEHDLVAAETAAALSTALLGATYPREKLREAWTVLLRNQFHDILPGSSIRSVYEEAERELAAAVATACGLRDAALAGLGAEVAADDALVVWNLSLDDRPLRFTAPLPERAGAFELRTADGRRVPHAATDTELIVSTSDVRVPSVGYTTLFVHDMAKGPDAATASGGRENEGPGPAPADALLDNGFLRVRVASDGTLASIYDVEADREVLAGRGNALWMYTDVPRVYEAWDVDEGYEREGRELFSDEPHRWVERSTVRSSLQVVRRCGTTTVEQEYRLWAGSRRLDVHTRIRWHGRRQMLRALFPLAVRHDTATFETAYGAVSRPTHRNTSWDAAAFEVPGLRWADLSEHGYGVSLLTDAKYGYSAHGGTLGLTLLRAPTYPDPLADEGSHTFTYSLLPHADGWRDGTVAAAHDLNDPLRIVPVRSGRGAWPATRSLIATDAPGLRLSSLKLAEDGDDLVLRLYEAHGARGRARATLDLPATEARPVDVLEEPNGTAAATVEAGGWEVEYRPYGVTTWRLPMVRRTEDPCPREDDRRHRAEVLVEAATDEPG
jgi:alpha-mannosidase